MGRACIGHHAIFVDDPENDPPFGTRLEGGWIWLGISRGVFLYLDPPGVIELVVENERYRPWQSRGERPTLFYPGEDGKIDGVEPFPGSVLDQLRGWAQGPLQSLDQWCDHWETAERQSEMVWFILTGEVPNVWPVKARRATLHARYGGNKEFNNTVISLTVQPWTSARTVAKTYRDMQRRLLGRENRPLSTRNLALFTFVQERAILRGDPPEWETLRRHWNRINPQRQYGDYKRLHRDYHRTRAALVAAGRVPDHVKDV